MPTHVFSKSTATIAAWNLATFEKLTDERRKEQARGLHRLDAEFITLVEIKDEDHVAGLASQLTKWGVDYEYTFLSQNSPTKRGRSAMHIGCLYKKGVKVENAHLMDGSDLGDVNLRRAFLADVTIGKLDFLLIGVHLKSGRDLDDQRIRDEQCKVIGGHITQLRGDQRSREPDILLMGDFNMIPGQDISNFHHLGGDDIMDFVSSWDLQERYSHILQSGRENLLDGFAISRNRSNEYIRGSLRLFPMHWNLNMGQAKFREKVSDHLPFAATFRIDSARLD